jgi:hypothetical protein
MPGVEYVGGMSAGVYVFSLAATHGSTSHRPIDGKW